MAWYLDKAWDIQNTSNIFSLRMTYLENNIFACWLRLAGFCEHELSARNLTNIELRKQAWQTRTAVPIICTTTHVSRGQQTNHVRHALSLFSYVDGFVDISKCPSLLTRKLHHRSLLIKLQISTYLVHHLHIKIS